MNSYERKLIIKDYKVERIIIHTWKFSYSSMFFVSINIGSDSNNENIININRMEVEAENPIKINYRMKL